VERFHASVIFHFLYFLFCREGQTSGVYQRAKLRIYFHKLQNKSRKKIGIDLLVPRVAPWGEDGVNIRPERAKARKNATLLPFQAVALPKNDGEGPFSREALPLIHSYEI
jgi:hypothetical protein